jgi:hypothetical protein
MAKREELWILDTKDVLVCTGHIWCLIHVRRLRVGRRREDQGET